MRQALICRLKVGGLLMLFILPVAIAAWNQHLRDLVEGNIRLSLSPPHPVCEYYEALTAAAEDESQPPQSAAIQP